MVAVIFFITVIAIAALACIVEENMPIYMRILGFVCVIVLTAGSLVATAVLSNKIYKGNVVIYNHTVDTVGQVYPPDVYLIRADTIVSQNQVKKY